MKLVACLGFISFCLIVGSISLMNDPELLIPLIKQVGFYYSASSIIFVLPTARNPRFDKFKFSHFTHTWCRMLEREDISTLAITIEKMPRLHKYYNSVVRPLIVVPAIGPDGFHEFSNITRSVKMSFFSWLLIFANLTNSSMHGLCYDPSGNPLSLSFNSQMLVLCGRDPILREWYSVDGDSTEISDLARWYPDGHSPEHPQNSMVTFTNLSLYERRNDLKGTILRGVSVKTSTLLTIKDNQLQGYFGHVVSELQDALNFTMSIVTYVKEYGVINMTTRGWSGAMGLVTSGDVDIGISDFSMTSTRLDYVDYTIPLITTRNCLFMRKPRTHCMKWFAYYKIFHISVWISIVLLLLVSQCVLVFIKSHFGSYDVGQSFQEECFRIWSIFCQQGLYDCPREASLRLAYFALSLTAIVVLAFYSASLISFLTAYVGHAPFRTVDEFIKDGTYDVIVIKGSADYDMFVHSKDPLSVAITKMMRPEKALPVGLEDGFREICADSKLAFYNTILHQQAINVRIPCKICCIDFGRIESLSMIFSKDNQYTPVLNYHLQKFLNTGVLGRYKVAGDESTYAWETKKFRSVGLASIVSLVMIFSVGCTLALLTLIVETYVHHRTRVGAPAAVE